MWGRHPGLHRLVPEKANRVPAPPLPRRRVGERFLNLLGSTSTECTKTAVTNATAVIKVMARHDRSGFVPKAALPHRNMRSVCIDRRVEAAEADPVRNCSYDGRVQKRRADRLLRQRPFARFRHPVEGD
jgi:hypothetical protein